MTFKKYIVPVLVAALFMVGAFSAHAIGAIYYHSNSVIGKTATSSTSFIVGGTGTTTVTYTSDGFDQASYYLSLASSSTQPTLCWRNQFSNDGVFWYADNGSLDLATSTFNTTNLPSGERETCWKYASSTETTNSNHAQLVGGADGKDVYLFRHVIVPNLDSLYTRTVFYVLPGVAGSGARIGIERNLRNPVAITK